MMVPHSSDTKLISIGHTRRTTAGRLKKRETTTEFAKILFAQHLRFSRIGTPSHARAFYTFRLIFANALWISRLTHVACIGMLLGLGFFTPQLGLLYFIGVAIAVAILIGEHALVRADDLSKVNLAFFTLNGFISLVLGTLGIIDVLRR